MEEEESFESITTKTEYLAELINNSKCTVIYTGAGISTAASIPDYRGPNGLWTQIRKTGTFSITKVHDLSRAKPTLTHMAISELCKRRIVNHVVSQNCDGLHLRSGMEQSQLSEIHGNMYIEVCPSCEKQYFRQADITERTARFRHKTGRKCHNCAEPNNNLIDTIVLYGERSRSQWPMNWERASRVVRRADLIICLGSSLKTLRRYNCLWPKTITTSTSTSNLSSRVGNGKDNHDTRLVIINLQYTSKDKYAVLKINGKCDIVMQLLMQKLSIEVPPYEWSQDPLNKISIPFSKEERMTLGRNLISESRLFETTEAKNPKIEGRDDLDDIINYSMKRSANELSQSPSLFVSEYTDDPSQKRLRMRIRAGNTEPSDEATGDPDTAISKGPIKEEIDEEFGFRIENCGIPGWLGKSIGGSRTSKYRRKRHGNKGRKHLPSVKLNEKS